MSKKSLLLPEAEVEWRLRCTCIAKISYECRWDLTGFYPSMVFIPLVYNNSDQNMLINDWYACLHVLQYNSITTHTRVVLHAWSPAGFHV